MNRSNMELMEPLTKRARSTNWSEQEKIMFRKLVLERATVIENKDTTTIANSAKKVAWEEVLSCFNAVSPNKRDLSQLLTQWRNMKNRAKKSEFTYRRARNMTGGGPPPPSPSREDRELIEAIPNEFFVDSNTYDSDSINITQTEESQQQKSESPVLVQNLQDESVASASQIESPISTDRVAEQVSTRPRLSAGHHKHKKKRNIPKPDCCNNISSHEHQLFVLAKAAREQAMKNEEEAHAKKMQNEKELHDKRMAVMTLEEEYLKLKLAKF